MNVPLAASSTGLQEGQYAQRLGIRELVPKPTSLDNLARSIQRTLQSR